MASEGFPLESDSVDGLFCCLFVCLFGAPWCHVIGVG
jgi:hypothetical protein